MRFFLFTLATVIFSCSHHKDDTDRKTTTETPNVLENFDWQMGAEFTQIKDNNAIALHLTRIDSLKFKYRIELNRQWKGSTFDTGTLMFDKVVADTGFFLNGQRPDCRLRIFVSNDSSQHDLFALVNRLCDDTTKNIGHRDFPKIRFKTGF